MHHFTDLKLFIFSFVSGKPELTNGLPEAEAVSGHPLFQPCKLRPLCGFRKYLYSLHGRSLEIPRGRGSLKPNIYKKSMKLKWNFLGGKGVQNKKPLGEYGYCLELHILDAMETKALELV